MQANLPKNDLVNRVNIQLMKLIIHEKRFLRRRDLFDDAINVVQNICNKFIKMQFFKYKNQKNKKIFKFGGQIFPFGSYEMGTLTSSSDIDLLLAAPKFISKQSIFVNLYSLLNQDSRITNLRKIESAYVPIIKFNINGIKVDLSYAIFNKNLIRKGINFLDDQIIRNMKSQSVVAFNGVRTTKIIQNMIPNPNVFKSVVQLLKIWAKKRYISGNLLGYFGGINLTLIAAYFCKNSEETNPFAVLLKIFNELSTWNWPNQISINQVKTTGNREGWTPNNNDVMPIITPAYPSINSMRNATKSSLHRMIKEISRAQKYTEKIERGECEISKLIAPPHFFDDYKFFFQIKLFAEGDNEMTIWKGYVENKMNHLTKKLEEMPDTKYAILFPHGFPFQKKNSNLKIIHYYYALLPTNNIDIKGFKNNLIDVMSKFHSIVIEKSISYRKPSMKISFKFRKREQIPPDILRTFGDPAARLSPRMKKIPSE